jgi:hypothetical protein
MTKILLVRLEVGEDGAFGVLVVDGQLFATCERTFTEPGGQQRVVIPVGRWLCKRAMYNKGGYRTFEIIVPGHDEVKFHRGNVELHSLGCVLVGSSFGEIGGRPAVLDSATAWRRFDELTDKWDACELEVRVA